MGLQRLRDVDLSGGLLSQGSALPPIGEARGMSIIFLTVFALAVGFVLGRMWIE